MTGIPRAVVFDSFGTLFDRAPLKERIGELGLPPDLAEPLFTRIVRDVLALDLAGRFTPFADVARGAMAALATEHGVALTSDEVDDVVEGFADLPAFPDVAPALDRLRFLGIQTAVLTNGSQWTAERLAAGNALTRRFDLVFSAESVGHHKPHPEPFLAVLRALSRAPGEAVYVSAHAWDLQGASVAGLQTAWLVRGERARPPILPSVRVSEYALEPIVDALTGTWAGTVPHIPG